MANQYIQTLRDFVNDFLRLFEIAKNGALKASRKRLEDIEEWTSRTEVQVIIAQQTGFEFRQISFAKVYRGDIATVNENKTSLLQLFGICFTAYSRLCKIRAVGIELDERYSLVKDADVEE